MKGQTREAEEAHSSTEGKEAELSALKELCPGGEGDRENDWAAGDASVALSARQTQDVTCIWTHTPVLTSTSPSGFLK